MLQKLAVALIATTMLLAPALAADAAKSPAATPAPMAFAKGQPAVKTVKAAKPVKLAKTHRTHVHHYRHHHHHVAAKHSRLHVTGIATTHTKAKPHVAKVRKIVGKKNS